ncbi:MAG: ABC transporter ATP-binding protein [Candidatus Auribacterota bacterium]|jgi:oligopeptide/dipeptide ABC transporter ATP-binding protein|nr:ABC transporter ATP-binding protein [Candidatus Auribacterota bacterium]
MSHNNAQQNLLEVEHLKKFFPIKKGFFSKIHGHVRAVDDISFTLQKKKTLGLVGESGCGKTTAGRTILRLLERTSGEVTFEGKKVFDLSFNELKKLRKEMQIIFQDPYSSLNPRMTVGSIIEEGLLIHNMGNQKQRSNRARELLEIAGLSADYYNRYPHEFSGGQRQRIGVARALALNPKFIVCDEAVSALDVSVQAQIINLLKQLQEDFELAYLFISHDLSVVRHMSDFIAVMYLGKIVEYAPTEQLFKHPLHPYTKALLSAIPVPDPSSGKKRIILAGDIPSPVHPPSGCYFHPRCPMAIEECSKVYPDYEEKQHGHFCACLRVPATLMESNNES